MGTTLATYYAKLQDMPDSEYKVEILEDGPIKKIAVNGKVYEVDVYKRQERVFVVSVCKKNDALENK